MANLRLLSVSFVCADRGDKLQNISVLLEPDYANGFKSALPSKRKRDLQDLPDSEF